MSGITEKFSESEPPRKPGRPRLFDDKMARSIDDGLAYTRRHQQNHFYALMFAVIVPDELRIGDLAWLFEGSNTPRYRRSTILAELGRLAYTDHPDAPGLACALATEIAQQHLVTKDALTLIRRHRREIKGQAQPPAHIDRLADEIIRAINGYSRRHPDMRQRTVLRALRVVEHFVRQTPDPESV